MNGGLGRTPGIPTGGGGGGLTIEEVNAQFIRNDDLDIVLPGELAVEGPASFNDGIAVDGLFQVTSATAGFTGALSAASVEIAGATLTDTLTVANDATFQGDVDFGGAVTGMGPAAVGLDNVDNTSDADKPISTATSTALAGKVAKAGDSMSGDLAMAAGTHIVFGGDTNLYRQGADLLRTDDVFQPAALYSASVGGTAAANLTLCADLTAANGRLYLAGTASGSSLTWFDAAGSNGVAIVRSGTGTLTVGGSLIVGTNLTVTGTVTGAGFTKALVGLSNVDNTSDANKPVSTATQTALDLKAPIASPTFTGTVSGVTAAMVGLGNVDNTSDANKPVSTAQAAADALKLSLTGGVMSGTLVVTKTAGNAMTARVTGDAQPRLIVGTDGKLTLGDGTSAGDTTLYRAAAGNALQTDDSLIVGADLTVTGTVTGAGFTKALVGLSNVDNTADTAKPVSTAQQTALDLKAPIASPTFTGTTAAATVTATGDITANSGTSNAVRLTASGLSATGTGTDQSVYTQAKGTGGVMVNNGTNSGTGGFGVYSGGPTPAIRASIGPNRGIDLSPASGNDGLRLFKSGEANYRLIIAEDGTIKFGSGAATPDVTLYRGGNDTLKTDDALLVSTSQSGVFALTVQNTHAAGHGLSLSTPTSTNFGFGSTVVGDNYYRYVVDCGGKIQWGDGNVAVDTSLYRDAADILRTNDEMRVDLALTAGYAAASTANVKLGAVGPSSVAGVLFGGDINLYRSSSTVLQCDKSLYATTNIAARSASGQGAVTIGNVGTGSTAGILFGTDTNLYRSAADTLKTDDALIVGGSVGFYGGSATAKQTVTGSRGANAALASLLTALAAIGLITDTSSA